MDKAPTKTEKKIGSTIYVVSSYCTTFSDTAIKNKISKLIKTEAVNKRK